MNSTITKDLEFIDNSTAQILFGEFNKNLHTIEQATGVSIHVRGSNVQLEGINHAVDIAESTLKQLYTLIQKGYPVFTQDIAFGVKILESSPKTALAQAISTQQSS